MLQKHARIFRNIHKLRRCRSVWRRHFLLCSGSCWSVMKDVRKELLSYSLMFLRPSFRITSTSSLEEENVSHYYGQRGNHTCKVLDQFSVTLGSSSTFSFSRFKFICLLLSTNLPHAKQIVQHIPPKDGQNDWMILVSPCKLINRCIPIPDFRSFI